MKLFQRGPAEVEPEESKREVPDGSQRLDLQRTFKLPQPKIPKNMGEVYRIAPNCHQVDG
jgi:hypothetical protein